MKQIFLNKKYNSYAVLGIIVLVCLSGLLVQNNYYIDILITVAYYAVLTEAWNIMSGYTGQLSLGHVAFMGLGQYTSVLLYTKLGLTPWVGILVGSLLAMLLAFFVGVFALRLKGPFFALATIAITTILQIVAVKWDGLTSGSSGITIRFEESAGNMIFRSYKPYYFMFICLLALVVGVTIYISRSKLGSDLVATRENDVAAASLGINLFRTRVIALLISAFFTSLAGSLYAQYTLFISPASSFNTVISQKTAILAIVGGSGTVFGPLIGAGILTPLEILLRGYLSSTYQGAYLVIYGVILIVVVLLIPEGIVGKIKHIYGRHKIRQLEAQIEKEDPNAFEGVVQQK